MEWISFIPGRFAPACSRWLDFQVVPQILDWIEIWTLALLLQNIQLLFLEPHLSPALLWFCLCLRLLTFSVFSFFLQCRHLFTPYLKNPLTFCLNVLLFFDTCSGVWQVLFRCTNRALTWLIRGHCLKFSFTGLRNRCGLLELYTLNAVNVKPSFNWQDDQSPVRKNHAHKWCCRHHSSLLEWCLLRIRINFIDLWGNYDCTGRQRPTNLKIWIQ